MKIFLLSVALISIAFSIRAQTDTNTVAIGINSPIIQHNSNLNVASSGTVTRAMAIADINFFLPRKWSFYAGAGYQYDKTFQNFELLQAYPYPYYEYAISKSALAQAGVRKWVPIKALNNRVAFIFDAGFNFAYGTVGYSNGYASLGYHDEYITLNPHVSPGVALFISKHWSIECLMGGIGYTNTNDNTIYTDGTPNTKTNNQQLYINVQPANWQVGFHYFFSGSNAMHE